MKQWVDVAGSIEVKVEHNQQIATLPSIVIKGFGRSLLGQIWLATLRLDWQHILSVKTDCTLQSVLDNYLDVLNDDLHGYSKEIKSENSYVD